MSSVPVVFVDPMCSMMISHSHHVVSRMFVIPGSFSAMLSLEVIGVEQHELLGGDRF